MKEKNVVTILKLDVLIRSWKTLKIICVENVKLLQQEKPATVWKPFAHIYRRLGVLTNIAKI